MIQLSGTFIQQVVLLKAILLVIRGMIAENLYACCLELCQMLWVLLLVARKQVITLGYQSEPR